MTDRIDEEARRAAERTMGVDDGRCAVCSWPLAKTQSEGCIPGDCSYRTDNDYERQRLTERRNEITRLAALITAAYAERTELLRDMHEFTKGFSGRKVDALNRRAEKLLGGCVEAIEALAEKEAKK